MKKAIVCLAVLTASVGHAGATDIAEMSMEELGTAYCKLTDIVINRNDVPIAVWKRRFEKLIAIHLTIVHHSSLEGLKSGEAIAKCNGAKFTGWKNNSVQVATAML